MRKFVAPVIVGVSVMLAACESESMTEEGDSVEASADTDESGVVDAAFTLDEEAAEGTELVQSESTAASFDDECLIAADSVAGIERPTTLGAFVNGFPAGTALSFQPLFMVDFGSLCVRSNGEDAICAIFESYDVETYSPDIEVMAMGVYADQCQTAEGVGPGTSVDDAVQAYGDATFAFSYENESREYVRFAEAPEVFGFRAESATAESETGSAEMPMPGGRHGGDYTGVEGDSYFETTVAHPDATIWEVWIN